MRFVNRAGGGIRIVRGFLERELSPSAVRSARVLDLGCGDGDIPLAVTRWANEKGYQVEFVCLDHNTKAVEMVRQAVDRAGVTTIAAERADAFSYRPDRDFDYAVGSMFFHHFTADEMSRLIEHLRGFVRKALLINDLRRSALNWLVCRALTVGIEPEIRHDALLSIRRGFRPADLSQIVTARVARRWFCRVAAVVRFDEEEGLCRPS